MLDRLNPEIKKAKKITDSNTFVRNLLIPDIKVAAVPATGLFKDQAMGKRFIRLSFCQTPETIKQAFENLKQLDQYLLPA